MAKHKIITDIQQWNCLGKCTIVAVISTFKPKDYISALPLKPLRTGTVKQFMNICSHDSFSKIEFSIISKVHVLCKHF